MPAYRNTFLSDSKIIEPPVQQALRACCFATVQNPLIPTSPIRTHIHIRFLIRFHGEFLITTNTFEIQIALEEYRNRSRGIQGRLIGTAEVDLVRRLLGEHPDWHRTGLSRELCDDHP